MPDTRFKTKEEYNAYHRAYRGTRKIHFRKYNREYMAKKRAEFGSEYGWKAHIKECFLCKGNYDTRKLDQKFCSKYCYSKFRTGLTIGQYHAKIRESHI